MKRTLPLTIVLALLLWGCASSPTPLDQPVSEARAIPDRYEKITYRIPMRDGVKLHTIVYAPRDHSRDHPIMLFRTPYSIGPYDEGEYRDTLGLNPLMAKTDDYVFAYQDVRGKYMSEGEFVNMRPHGIGDFDESTDTWDTVEYLTKNVPANNGRVGMWGISYPGFYAAAGMIDAHPALIAVSPQAPIADWWYDDFHHHGAFFLPHAFNFISSFGMPRPEPTARRNRRRWSHGTPDGYQFFMDLGPLKNANEKYLKHEIAFWDAMIAHPNRDEFWTTRDILPHLSNVAPAVMTVGGWFDAEDLYGPLNIYRSVEEKNPSVDNVLVMGPWRHGGWSRTTGERLGNVSFGARTSDRYESEFEKRFFDHYLRPIGAGVKPMAEATVFETGGNQWRYFDEWPPAQATSITLFAHGGGQLDAAAPDADDSFDSFVSDPEHPVPFTEEISIGMTRNYMTDDQRFAARRPDVLVYETDVLEDDIVVAGPIGCDLWVSTSAQDADWIVKLIDVFPDDAEDDPALADNEPRRLRTAGYQMMVRSEVIRGRFRNDPANPRPFAPGQPTLVHLPLQDVLHRFRAGHRLMVQIQSTWFPLVDRNPQSWVDNIFEAGESDFIPAEHRVYHQRNHATRFTFPVLSDD